MKHCPYCGKELPEEMQFCPYCMKKLIAEQPVAGMPVKKRLLGWPIIVGGIVVLAVVCALVIGLLPNLSQDAPAAGSTTTFAATTTQLRVRLSDRLLSAKEYSEEIKKLHPETASYKLASDTDGDMIYTNTGLPSNYSGAYLTTTAGVYNFVKKSGSSQYVINYTPSLDALTVTVPSGMGTIRDAIADATAMLKNYPGGLTAEELYEKFQTEGERVTEYANPYTEYGDTIHGVKYHILKTSTHVAVRLEFTMSYFYTVTEPTNGTVGGSSSTEAGGTTAVTGGTITEPQNGAVGSGNTTVAKGNTTTMKGNTTTTKENATKTKGKATTTKRSATTKATNSTSAQGGAVDQCAAGHTWQAITETVEHDEVGHYEQAVTGYNTVTTYKCAVCYDTFESLSAYYMHFEEHENSSDPLVGILRERYETSTRKEPVYGQKWVVDKKAYTEQVVVGYRCGVCGTTQ